MHNTHLSPRWLGGVTGLVAGALGIAVATLVAGTRRVWRSPVLDVGDRVIDNVPVWLKELAISWFGTNDKIALLVGIGFTLALFAGLLGHLASIGRMRVALAGVVLFALIGSWSALGESGSSLSFVIPTLIGSLVVAAALIGARRWLDARGAFDASPTEDNAPYRRTFIAGLGATAVAAWGVWFAGNRLEGRFSAAGSRNNVQLAGGADGPPIAPAEITREGAAPFYTPNADFYRIDTALVVPQVPADSYRLRVTGMVDNPIELTYEDIQARGLVESDITLTCVSNLIGGGLVGTARWQGIRLDELLEEAGVQAGADQIVGRSVDGYTCGFPVAALDGRDALVAVAMNGEPLPLEHGFPVRLIVPGIYGYASATKWLTEIEVTTFDQFDHYWVPRGYAALAPIKMQTRIDSPRGLDKIDAGQFAIGGVAWAQPTGISAVQIKFDDGPWIDTDIADELNGSTWRQWNHIWDATPGRHTITARAIDQNGTIQTVDRDEPLPDGVTGHHSVVVLVSDT